MHFIDANAIDLLIDGKVDFLLNQVNCMGVYNAGIAKEIGERLPNSRQQYLSKTHKGKCHLGEFLITTDGVIHLYGQYGYGYDKTYTNHEALYLAFIALNKTLKENSRIAIPDMIGCGIAGGDRDRVIGFIERAFNAHEVFICNKQG